MIGETGNGKRFSALKKADAVAQKELSEDDRTSDTVNGRERTTQPDNSCLRGNILTTDFYFVLVRTQCVFLK